MQQNDQTQNQDYALVDSGDKRKLERFGPYLLSRPCSQAVWKKTLPENAWAQADATFVREGDTKWTFNRPLPAEWTIEVEQVRFRIAPTDFGHLGIFPEQRPFWQWLQTTVTEAKKKRQEPIQVLNLFAYSGGSTLAAAKAGAHVCHLDASKGMVQWARENAAINGLTEAPIRWIVEDVTKFLQREIKRGRKYDAIILDPPTFGRGANGELFKIEEEIVSLLHSCKLLLSDHPLFIFFSCHTPGFTPIVLGHLLEKMLGTSEGNLDVGEMVLSGSDQTLTVPSGTFARWSR